jgi:hypothetical protein
MPKACSLVLGLFLLAAPATPQTRTPEDPAAANARQAHAALDAMVQALGGQRWLDIQNQARHGHVAAFFHGNPDPGTTEYWDFHQWPDRDRVEYTKHRDVVQLYIGKTGTEITYKGKAPLPQDQVDDFIRRREHSIETVIKVWLKNPNTILVYEGQHLAERHLAEQVTLISPENEAVTILMDVQTHLPLRRTFEWRDPVYKDKNLDAEEYDDYHPVNGLPTAFRITRFKNDEMISQRYIDKIIDDQNLAGDFWDVEATTRRIKH